MPEPVVDEKTLSDVSKAVDKFREIVETVQTEHKSLTEKMESFSGVDKETLEKIDVTLKDYDEKNQEVLLAATELKNAHTDTQERLANMEKNLLTTKKDDPNYKESEEYKALNQYCIKGLETLGMEERKFLRTDVGAQGAFLVPEVLAEDILKKIEEISDVRRLSRVRSRLGVKTLNIPIRNTIPTASYEGEAEQVDESESTYESQTMTAHRQTVNTNVTTDILEFAGFDMESEIMTDATVAFAQREGNRFLQGTGVKQPLGILDTTTGIAQTESTVVGQVPFDDVIQLFGQLKVGYDPVYFFNRLTLVTLRTEKDSNGNYLWRIGGETQPTTINDVPYVILQDMPDIAANSLSIGIGDFFRGYNILDAVNLSMIRDNVTQARKAQVIFTWHRWNDGRPVLTEAFKLLRTKA